MDNIENMATLCGILKETPVFSHASHGADYYISKLAVKRTSGTEDLVNILARFELFEGMKLSEGDSVFVQGELRSFNNKSGEGSRLIITVFAKTLEKKIAEAENIVLLKGALCKPPNVRQTPLGREICDIIVAVNRKYGRADYLPCIVWGRMAQETAKLHVGAKISLEGRIQSRNYIKLTDTGEIQKTAFEVSVSNIQYEE